MRSISLFAMDVDGVLTDGTLEYGPGGACQRFDAHDGAGLVALQKTGMPLALISFRDLDSTISPSVIIISFCDASSSLFKCRLLNAAEIFVQKISMRSFSH